jgi:hypothetical protein
VYKTVVGKNIGFDHFCVVEENIIASDGNTDFGVVQGTNDLTIAQVVRVCDFVQGMGAVWGSVYGARTKQALTATPQPNPVWIAQRQGFLHP